jgi:hypothetical protein
MTTEKYHFKWLIKIKLQSWPTNHLNNFLQAKLQHKLFTKVLKNLSGHRKASPYPKSLLSGCFIFGVIMKFFWTNWKSQDFHKYKENVA